MNYVDQEKYLLSRKGSRVKFVYPTTDPVHKKMGTLEDRVVCFSRDDGNVVYWNVIDKIRFEGKDWIRFTYYRYLTAQKKWVFAGQTSLCDPVENITSLFMKACEKDWFQKILNNSEG